MSQIPNLYSLLPAVYQQQDQQQNFTLKSLFSIVQQEFETILLQIDTAYNNCFIETCEDWVEPYIARLLGISDLDSNNLLSTQRARIANTVRYRRRKGQPAVLERIISDVTGWFTSILEYWQLLGITQNIQHIRPDSGKTMDIRNLYGVSTLGTAFEVNSHRVDVRNYPTYPAKFNINDVGLFIWRLESYQLNKGVAAKVTAPNQMNAYTFNPIGFATQLFNRQSTLSNLTATATESTLPVAIRAEAFQRDLLNYQNSYAQLPANQQPSDSEYYGPNKSIYLELDDEPVNPIEVVSADLNWEASSWTPPTFSSGQLAAIDVTLGRLLLADSTTQSVTVNYYYGFSAPLGGGPYDRRETDELIPVDANTIFVPTAPEGSTNAIWKPTLQEAIAEWATDSKYSLIQILDNATYTLNSATHIDNSLNTNSPASCIIQATNNMRPCIQVQNNGVIALNGSNEGLSVQLKGLYINGRINVQANVDLDITHCTLVPQADTASVSSIVANNSNSITIGYSITGAVYLPDNMNLTIHDSIMDAPNSDKTQNQYLSQKGIALAALDPTGKATDSGPYSSIQRTTVLGSIHVAEMHLLSESIVTGQVIADRTQNGNVRFSYLPLNSQTPPRYLCQPDTDPLQPQFTSIQYNDPGYCQLNSAVQQSIATGAANGAEMGCFQLLNQPLHQKQLQTLLDEYLPLGLYASRFYVT